MKQFVIEIHDSIEIIRELQPVQDYLKKTAASSVLVKVYSGFSERGKLEGLVGLLVRELPDASIIGLTCGGEIKYGSLTPQSITVVISVFEETSIQILQYKIKPGEEEASGEELRRTIDATPEIKAVELLVDCWEISSKTLFSAINRCAPQVQIFGAVPYAHDVKDTMFVFSADSIAAAGDVTAIAVLYAGEDFHITTDYVIGWKPMGTAMKVTKARGKVLMEIDHQPALAVYDKFLKIPNDEHFYDNAFEFPFLRYVNDTYMLRMPFFCLEDGSISLVAPVEAGDTLYLSYGDISTILAEIYEARGRMARFHPQYIHLYDCATRKTFWSNRIDNEIHPFQKVTDTYGCFTGGEILRVNGEIIHFNATLVIVGMREGAPDPQTLLRISQIDRSDEATASQTSMVRRMAHFINVAMQELTESNRRLHVMATTDEQTGLLNRRELSRIIAENYENGKAYSLIMADIDDFKKINDTYGHDAGDTLLVDVAGVLKRSLAGFTGTMAGRWGGEEFMVLLPGYSMDAAEQVAEKIRTDLEQYMIQKEHPLTISLGVADADLYADMKNTYHDVDRALYEAKRAGKNRVVRARR